MPSSPNIKKEDMLQAALEIVAHGCSEGRGEEGNGTDHTKDLFLKGRYLWSPQYSGELLQEKQ